MNKEKAIINNHIAQFGVIDKALDKLKKQNKKYQAYCRKCGNPINLDAGEEGLCQWCV